MRITTDELKQATLYLLKHLDECEQSEITINEDFYWDIPENARYDSYEKPDKLTLGQLSDDWSEIQAILRGDREPVGCALVWLSTVLRRVGEKAMG